MDTSISSPSTGAKDDEAISKSAKASSVEPTLEMSSRIKHLYELVPEVGSTWRWYDILYKVLSWCLRSWPRRLIPPIVRRLLGGGINVLLTINHHERNKAEPLDEPRDNLILPEGARLRQGGMWTIELFPPSKYRNLERSLRNNGWEQSSYLGLGRSNVESVRSARDGQGADWWKIGLVARPDTKYLVSDAKREELPLEFEFIELTAVQLGTGITAVVAFFRLSECGESSLNNVWCKNHEPILKWRWFRRPIAINRYFSAVEATQNERLRIHSLARRWMSERCPGSFASKLGSHPVIDLNLFDGIDPVTEGELSESGDGMRALGMQWFVSNRFVSPEMKGVVLIPTDGYPGPHEPLRNCWAIAGEYQRVVDENERVDYGDKPYAPGALGHIFNDAARSFILHLAVMGYLRDQRAVYSAARDLATIRHRRFTIKRARKLSIELLESGLDLPAVARDSRQLWGERWRKWHGIEVHAMPVEVGQRSREGFDLIKRFGEHGTDQFEQLLEEEKNYRTVLSTAAALGASTESARIGRRALFVAGCSMAVAVVTLIITQPGDASLWSVAFEWVRLEAFEIAHIFKCL
jgi:hypothetical protein